MTDTTKDVIRILLAIVLPLLGVFLQVGVCISGSTCC
nr:YqaE/Pmp3 family membrane protein [Desulfuromonas thiophila]